MSTKLITVNRKWQTTESTISTFHTIASHDCNHVMGYVLEEKGPSSAVANQELRVPAGVYTLKWHSSRKFGRTLPLLYSGLVPASRYILIHNGNHAGHTEGCLLVGGTKRENFVGNSKPKLEELLGFLSCYDLDSGNFTLEITENFS